MRLLTLGAVALLACACTPYPGASTASSKVQPAAAVDAVRHAAIALRSQPTDYDALVASIGDSTRILLGESTHGTQEYYRERARITLRLVRERGVSAVAIEGDWSPTSRVNRYVRGLGSDRSSREALRGFTRFPRWMWSNAQFAEFVEQLRAHNLTLPAEQRVGLYGMDVYDLFDAADAVVDGLQRVDRAAARRVRSHYRCFGSYGRNTYTYGAAVRSARKSCQAQAAAALAEVRRLPLPCAPQAAEAHFDLVRAAASVVAAEEYFRATYGGENAWNLRDRRMVDTVETVAEHQQRLIGRPAKVVIWSHNSHTGDARATDAAKRGELNIGQLMKQRHGPQTYLVGFFTHGGTVLAASQWDQPGLRQRLRPALPESHSGLFHRTGTAALLLVVRGNAELERRLAAPMLQRAVGVVYVPNAERRAHYFSAVLPRQFDAAIYFDQTEAVRPL
jgi:erythromycin esterase-like protein